VTRASVVAAAIAAAALGPGMVAAQVAPETFTATASMKVGNRIETAPVAVTITRYTSDAERDAVVAAVRGGGTAGTRTVMAAMKDAGFIEVAGRRTTIKYAFQRPTASGRLVTVVAAEPILFLGAGIPPATPTAGFELAIAILDLSDSGPLGELAPAAKIGLDQSGALVIEDPGTANATLTRLTRTR
jgi:hypothetical protein